MDTLKMVEEIKTACTALENEKSKLTARVKQIDDDLTAYRMAMESLELTVRQTNKLPVLTTIEAKPKKHRKYKTKRTATRLEFNGKSKTVAQWAKETGIGEYTIRYRMKNGWSIADTLTKPVNPVASEAGKRNQRAQPKKVFAYDSHENVIRQFVGVGDASRELKLPVETIEKLIECVSKEDQIRCRNYYLAYHI